jgi:hypothetical protein
MDVLQIATAFMSRVLPSCVNSSREQTGTLGYGRRETLTPPRGAKSRNSTLRTSGEGLEKEEIVARLTSRMNSVLAAGARQGAIVKGGARSQAHPDRTSVQLQRPAARIRAGCVALRRLRPSHAH